MPTYDYVCDDCGEMFEVKHSILESPPVMCGANHLMRRDVAASFPHVSLQWHKDQGIGSKLVLQSTRRQGAHGNPSYATST